MTTEEQIDELILEIAHEASLISGGKTIGAYMFLDAKAAINRLLVEARQNELARTCIAGMGGLTPKQQLHIEDRIAALKSQLGEK